MKQKKSLAQVFLKDKQYIQKILDALDIAGETVLEIGSGPGNISAEIARRAKRLFCLEIDPRFCAALAEKFCHSQNTQVIQEDILKFPLSRLAKKVVIFGNTPYQISAKLMEYLVCWRPYIKRVYLTFQREFSQKLLAEKSTPSFGFISCFVQYYAKVEKIFDIPAGSFQPQPKVDSTFIKIEFYKSIPHPAGDEAFLFENIRKAFAQRRKKIINSLGFSQAKNILPVLKIDPALRAEDIGLKEYVDIANKIKEKKKENY